MAFDAFLKLKGIDGESTDHKHKDWIEILSFSFGVTQPTSVSSATGGRSAERAHIQDLHITKVVDKSSPVLFQKCCLGEHIPEANLELCLASGDKHLYLKYTLENVIISSLQDTGSSHGGDNKPMQNLSLNFGKIKMEYTPIDGQGKPGSKVGPVGWNLEENKKM